jgi:hypothetical protein
MDVDTHECFRVTPDQTLERLYPKLPSNPLRVKGAIYEVTIGVHTKWNGKQTQELCRDCVAKHKTLAQQEVYKMEGYRVFVVWEHEYGASEKAKCPVHIQEVVRGVC